VPRLELLEGRALLSSFTVTSDADSTTGPTLRAGIASGADTIVFALPSHDTIKLTLGDELAITKSLDIEGPGANKLTISGNNTSRVFDISGHVTVTIAGLTIANGLATSTGIAGAQLGGQLGGGGILNEADARLNLTRCSVVNNKAYAGSSLDVFGGGLLNLGTAKVTSCTFTGNEALDGSAPPPDFFGGSAGGAIDNFGGAKLTVTDSTFMGNQAKGAAATTIDGTPVAFYGMGGAIENNAGFNNDSPSTAYICDSTFVANEATAGTGGTANGGAIDNQGVNATMTLTHCTVKGNLAIGGSGGSALGGGILNFLLSQLTVTDCSVTANLAVGGTNSTPTVDTPGAGSASGGGIENAVLATLIVTHSAVEGNLVIGGTTTIGPGGNALGGGIDNAGGNLELSDSMLQNNSCIAGSGGSTGSHDNILLGVALGAGLNDWSYALPDGTNFPGTATVTSSSIVNNRAHGGAGGSGVAGGDAVGGGIAVGSNAFFLRPDGSRRPDGSSITVRNSTIASNLARGGNGGSGADGGDGLGGGIWFGPDSTGTFDNSVIAGNFALGGQAGAGGSAGHGRGGGLYVATGALVQLKKSLVILNFASTSNYNIYGIVT